jgi:endo-1,4-beta-xylanase
MRTAAPSHRDHAGTRPSHHFSLWTTRPRRAAVLGLSLAAATLGLLGDVVTAANPTLPQLAEAQGRYSGGEITANLLSNTTVTNLAGTTFDMVTPGNEMKWDTTEPSRGSFNFGPGDQIVTFAQGKSMRIRGHNLVWHSQLPGWVSSLPLNQVQAAMENHITTEATHYKGKLFAWDVVNEPFNEDGSLRSDVFFQAMGAGYIADALRTAHAADPNAKLYLNDFNIEGSGVKADAMFNLVQSLLSQGVPINGVGFESHFILGQVPSSLQTNMARFAALGIDVAITELDDRIQLPATMANLNQQATDFTNVWKACLAVSRCVGVSQWAVGDADSWIPGFFSGMGAATMFDSSYQPKQAFNALVTLLGGTTPPPPPPPPPGTCDVADAIQSWNTGLVANMTITNTSTTPITGWTLSFTLPAGQVITSGWNASYSPTSGAVSGVNLSYNATLAPGASTTLGFQATHTGNAAPPASFKLNGQTCTTH